MKKSLIILSIIFIVVGSALVYATSSPDVYTVEYPESSLTDTITVSEYKYLIANPNSVDEEFTVYINGNIVYLKRYAE